MAGQQLKEAKEAYVRLARTEVKYVMLMSGQLEKQSKLIVGSKSRVQTGAKPTVRSSS